MSGNKTLNKRVVNNQLKWLLNLPEGYLAAISACVGTDCSLTDTMERMLRAEVDYIKVVGKWGGVEEVSFLVFTESESMARALVETGIYEFNQEDVYVWKTPMTMADITEGTDEGTKLDGKYYYFDLDKIIMNRDNVKGRRPTLDESKTLNEREGNKMSIEQRVISVLDELHYLEKIGKYSYIYYYNKSDYRDELDPETIDNLIASAKSGDLTEAWYDLISNFDDAGYTYEYITNEVVEALEKVTPLTDEEFDEAKQLIWESIDIDYSTYLDDEVPVYIMVDTGDGNYDFTLNPNYSFNWDGETVEDEPLELASLTWLAGTQGYTLDQVLEAFREGRRNNKFLNSVVREGLENSSSMSAVTFLGTMRILDLLNAASGNRDVTINADTYVGLFDTWGGSGSLFDIELEQGLVIPGNIINRIGTAKGKGDNGYTPDQVYGFSGSVYNSKINLLEDLDRGLTENKTLTEAVIYGESKNFVGDNIKSEVHDKMVREFEGSTLNKSHIEGIVKEILEDIVDERINIKINYQRASNRVILLAIIHATGIKNKFQFRFTLEGLGQDRVKVEKVETIIVDAKDSLNENYEDSGWLDFYKDEIKGEAMTLRKLLSYGLNAVYEGQTYRGYDEDDFTEEELNQVVLPYELDYDADGYMIVRYNLVENTLTEDKITFISEMRYKDYVIEFFKDTQYGQYYWQADYDGNDRKLSNFNVWITTRGISLSYQDNEGYPTKANAVSKAREWVDKQKRRWDDSLTEATKISKQQVVSVLKSAGLRPSEYDISSDNFIVLYTPLKQHKAVLMLEEVFGENSVTFTRDDGVVEIKGFVKDSLTEATDIIQELNQMMYEYGYSTTQFQEFLKDVYLNKFTDKKFNEFGIKGRQEVIDYAKEVRAWKFDSLTEATTGFTIEYPNGEFYIGKPHDLYELMTDFLIDWDNDKTTMTEYEAEDVASIRENYKEVFYAALEGGNYWRGQEFEEVFGRFSDYGIANTLNNSSNESLQDYYQDEILGKSLILRDLLNIEFPLNALTNDLGEYLGYDEEDFTKEELDSRVIVTDIYTDADGLIGAEIKYENRDLIENITEDEKMYEIEYFEKSGWAMKKVYDKETMLQEVEKMLNSHLVKEYRVSVIDEENNRELIHYRKKQGGQAEVMVTDKWEALTENKTLTEGHLINTMEFINKVNNSREDYTEYKIRFFGGGGVIITLTSLTELYVTDIDTNETVLFATLETLFPTNKYDWAWELRDKLLDLEIILGRGNWRKELKFEDSLTENRKTTEVYRLEIGAEYEEEMVHVDVYNFIFYTDLDKAKAAGEAHLQKDTMNFLTDNYYIIYDVMDKLERWEIDEINQTGYTEAVAEVGVNSQNRIIYESENKLQEGLSDFDMVVEYIGGF